MVMNFGLCVEHDKCANEAIAILQVPGPDGVMQHIPTCRSQDVEENQTANEKA